MNIKIDIPEEKIQEFCKKNRIIRLSFFGSVLRDDFDENSDIDILVEFDPDAKVGFISLSGMELELGEILGKKVDLNTEGLLSPYFKSEVLNGAFPAYEQ